MDLSRASLQAQERAENQLREKATTVLSAASIVVPIAALGVGRGPAGAAIPLGAAAVAYSCVLGRADQRFFRKTQVPGCLVASCSRWPIRAELNCVRSKRRRPGIWIQATGIIALFSKSRPAVFDMQL